MTNKNSFSLKFLFLILLLSVSGAQEIISTTPAQNQLNVDKNTYITATFDSTMNASTINDTTFIVQSPRAGLYTGTYTYNAPTHTAQFTPDKDFTVGEVVTVTLTTNIETESGDSLLNPYQWSFTIKANASTNAFQRIDGYPAGYTPWDIYSSDLNGDGFMDLITINTTPDSISVFLNNGDGTFAPITQYQVGDTPLSVFSSDIDNDDDMDVVVANSVSDSVSVLLNNGEGTFTSRADYAVGDRPVSVFLSDLNGDGSVDLVTANKTSDDITVLFNNGEGTFITRNDYPTGSNACAISSADLDNDGDMDLVNANDFTDSISVFLNTGDGTFAPGNSYSVCTSPRSIAVSDFNGDGFMDLAVANYTSSNISILLNNGSGEFMTRTDYPTEENPSYICAADLDGDGDFDLALVNVLSDYVTVLLNEGSGTSFLSRYFHLGENPNSITSADFDGDGDMDLAVASSYNNSSFYVLYDYDMISSSTSPVQNELNVNGETNISVTFNSNMDFSSIDNNSFVVQGSQTGLHTGIFTNDGNAGVTFNPDHDFAAGEVVTVLLTTDIQTLTGDNLLYPYQWSFTIRSYNSSCDFQADASYTTGSDPCSVCPADLDGDEDIDLVLVNQGSDSLSVFLNNGDGTFAEKDDFQTESGPAYVRPADFDRDGHMDLAVLNFTSDQLSVLMNSGSGSFDSKTDYGAGSNYRSIVAVDFDSDGYIDLITGMFRDMVHYAGVLRNSTYGTFPTRQQYTSNDGYYSITSSDLDNDGDMDLALAAGESSNNISVLKNRGDGVISQKRTFPVRDGSYYVISSDFNGDGNMDLVVSGGSDSISVLLNYGDGSFAPKIDYYTGNNSGPVCPADFNGDGDMDIAVLFSASGSPPDSVAILLNNGQGSFNEKLTCPAGDDPQSLCAADFDGDGVMDLAITNNNTEGPDYLTVLLNYGTPDNIDLPLEQLPIKYALNQNYPNPFNPVTQIKYQMPERSFIEINVYNILGQKVATLYKGNKQAGYHTITWNASAFSSGVYFIKMKTQHFSDTKKCILLK